jgi:hypothetical protein
MNPSEVAEASPLHDALDGFATAVDHLVKVVDDGAVDVLDAVGLVGFLHEFEAVRNRLPVVDHRAIRSAVERDLPHTLCRRSMVQVLMQALLLSPGEASRRVKAAEQLADRQAMTGESLGPWRPHLAAAQRRGELSTEQVAVIDTALRQVDGRGFDPAEVEAGEQILVDAATGIGPHDLRRLAQQVVEAIDPDGTVPDDQVQQDRRFFRWRHARDGSFRGEFRLTPQAGAKLKAILDPLAAPHLTRIDLDPARTDPTRTDPAPADPAPADPAPADPAPADDAAPADAALSDAAATHPTLSDAMFPDAGFTGDAAGSGQSTGRRVVVEDDPRSHDQRMHDAVEAACDRLLRAGGLSGGWADNSGIPATVIVTIDADDLASRTGFGQWSDGSPVSAEAVIDLADQAEVAWCVKNSRGAVLSLGRSRRLASRQQSLALIARDGGCSFPGCDTVPEWCERHHVVSWIDGGATDLDNLTLLCRYHHHNFAGRGWICRINSDRLPEWTPPKWIDQRQRPILHSRIRTRRWRAGQGPP